MEIELAVRWPLCGDSGSGNDAAERVILELTQIQQCDQNLARLCNQHLNILRIE